MNFQAGITGHGIFGDHFLGLCGSSSVEAALTRGKAERATTAGPDGEILGVQKGHQDFLCIPGTNMTNYSPTYFGKESKGLDAV